MKKIAKLMCAFVLAGFASCTNDTTEDLVNVPTSEGGQVTLTATIADAAVRTELGEKTVDGKYPLYWSEGDVLSVNGEAATVAINAENAAVGSFTTTVAAPFNIVYPHVEGLGASVVRFAEVQPHTEGTFAAASAPMYGYAESATAGVAMKHLTGIMRFAITSAEGVKLTAINIEAGTAIAGDFAIDCTTGELTAQEGKTSTGITYTFAENEGALSTTASHFYVAVPAGAYGDISVSFVAEGGKIMLASFNGSNIKAGVVREFQEVPFTDNASEFLIYDEATLLDFAQKVANDSFKPDAARVSASFEVSAETAAAWTPIEGFAKMLNGGGKTISGMTKPLFGALAGMVKNLNIAGAYTTTLGSTFGALAVTAAEGALIEGCSLAEGSTITVEGTTAGETKVGGLVGDAVATLKDLANYATITVVAENAEANLAIGGVVGKAFCEIDNCDNYGTLTVGAATLNDLNIGGVVGLLDAKLDTSFNIANCDNSGVVTVSKDATLDLLAIGGIAGSETLANTEAGDGEGLKQTYTFDTCANTGKVSFYGTISATGEMLHIGGITGSAIGAYKNCSNGVKDDTEKGAVYVTGTILNLRTDVSRFFCIAGIVGCNNGGATANSDFDDCTNYAPITCDYVSLKAMWDEKQTHAIRIAGIYGGRFSGNRNTNVIYNRNSTNYGKITLNHNDGPAGVTIAGISGYNQIYTQYAKNYGDIEANVTGLYSLYLGGISGYNNVYTTTECENHGNITITGQAGEQTLAASVYAGGLFGLSTWPVLNRSLNKGNITVTDVSAPSGNIYVAGITAMKEGAGRMPLPTNTGNITVRGSSCKVGVVCGIMGDGQTGIAGDVEVYDGTSDYVTNSGTIDVELTTTGNYYVSGGVGWTDGVSTYGAKNTGKIISNSTVGGNTHIGGLIAHSLRHATQYTHSSCVNTGDITVTGSSTGELAVAGITGYSEAIKSTSLAQKHEKMRNEGNIYVNLTSSAEIITAGGALGNIGGSMTEIYNSGDVTVRGKSGDTCHVGGAVCVCNCVANTIENTNIHNLGKVDVSLTDSNVNLYIAGAIGYAKSSMTGCTNSGEVIVSGTGKTVRVGGVWGYQGTDSGDKDADCTNTGSVSVSTVSTGVTYVGGVHGSTCATASNLYNNGSVSFSGESTTHVYVGGVCGSAGTSNQGYYENQADGKVTVSGRSTGGALIAGGLMGYFTLTTSNGGHNYATVEITRDASAAAELAIGGCLGYVNAGNSKTLQDLVNSGSVVCSGEALQDCYVGGVAGYAASRNNGAKYTLKNLTCDCDRVRLNSSVAMNLYMGGIIGATDADDNSDAHTLGINTAVEIGGGASIAGTQYFNEKIGLADPNFLTKSLGGTF